MNRRRRSAIAARIILTVAVLAVSVAAVGLALLSVLRGGHVTVPCPAPRPGDRPCVERVG